MPTVNAIPCKRGMELEELYGRLQSGWTLLGRQKIQRGKAIATPNNPEGSRLEDADVWVLNEPMIPLGMLAQMFLVAMSVEDPLEVLAQEIFGKSLAELQQVLTEMKDAQGSDPSAA